VHRVKQGNIVHCLDFSLCGFVWQSVQRDVRPILGYVILQQSAAQQNVTFIPVQLAIAGLNEPGISSRLSSH